MDIIILDHHECDVKNDYAIVVNNHMCDYPNKNLSGVGIVYKFLCQLDDLDMEFVADSYLDLVALGNIADVMDLKELETRYYCNMGLAHISNQLIAEYVGNSYYISANATAIDMQFSVIPYLNAIIRAGKQEDKELLFKALTEQNEMFRYNYIRTH